ncbi:MAG: hypothetical protein RR630_03305 [Coprobacillus sp.]
MKVENRKKQTSIILVTLILLIVMTVFPSNVLAGTVIDKWDGTSDESWYDENKSEFHINTAEQLASLEHFVGDLNKNFKGKTIYLDVDLDLGGHNWVSIGKGASDGCFAGVFDGQGHQIYNLTSKSTTSGYHGLFGAVSMGGVVKNTHIVDADFITADNGGNSLPDKDTSTCFGILADWANNATIINCSTSGKIKSTTGEKILSGLVASCTGSTQIIGCSSSAKIESYKTEKIADVIGGLVGQWENPEESSKIVDSWFDGSIYNEYDETIIGGILGFDYDNNLTDEKYVEIKNCFMATDQIIDKGKGNIVSWVASFMGKAPSYCYWAKNNQSNTIERAISKVTVSGINANVDSSFNQSQSGEEVVNLKDMNLIEKLNKQAFPNITWVMGMKHPVFKTDLKNTGADYSKVDSILTKVPADLNVYTEESKNALKSAIDSIDRNKNSMQQDIVDGYVIAIENALENLKYRGADYSEVDIALSKVPNDLSVYTDSSREALETVINGIDRNKNVSQQEIVNGYVTSITKALLGLEKKAMILNDYMIIEGAGQSVLKNSKAVFKSNADFNKFQKVLIDNVELDSKYYDVTNGSTIVTLHADFINTLSTGKHIINIVSQDGQAKTTFTIGKNQSPDTGDITVWPMTVLFISALGILWCRCKLRKE